MHTMKQTNIYLSEFTYHQGWLNYIEGMGEIYEKESGSDFQEIQMLWRKVSVSGWWSDSCPCVTPFLSISWAVSIQIFWSSSWYWGLEQLNWNNLFLLDLEFSQQKFTCCCRNAVIVTRCLEGFTECRCWLVTAKFKYFVVHTVWFHCSWAAGFFQNTPLS